MSGIQAEVVRLLWPDDNGMLGIRDRTDPGAPVPDRGWFTSGSSGFRWWLAAPQIQPRLLLEVWNGPPPEPPADHEVQQTTPLQFATGQLRLDGATDGDEDLVAVAPGRYTARITGWNREETRLDLAMLAEIHPDRTSRVFTAGCAMLRGRERYQVQLWPEQEAYAPVTCDSSTVSSPTTT